MTTLRKSTGGRWRDIVPALRRLSLTAGVALLGAACVPQQASFVAAETGPALSGVPLDVAVTECREALAAAEGTGGPGLAAGHIRLLNWNVQKKRSATWRRDFDQLTADADFVLMQEAALGERTDNSFAAGRHWSFAPGHRSSGSVSGVLTLSRSAPLVRCGFTSREPWFRTAKATSISAYALAGVEETLVVVNIHALNFSLGLSDYQAQFARVNEVLRDHDGPVIVAGDFNTWRGRRMEIVAALARSLELYAVQFADDERLRFFGLPLDHIYVRDLELRHADTDVVVTSDHNPMKAVLHLPMAYPQALSIIE